MTEARSLNALQMRALEDVDGLLETLANPDASPEERMLAASGLGKFREGRVRDALVAELRDPDFSVRVECVRSLGKQHDKQAIPPLLERAVELESSQEYRWVLSSLAALDAREVEPLILQELTTWEMPRRRWMAHLLGFAGSRSAIASLREAARVDRVFQRRWYYRAIWRIKRRASRG